MAKKITPLRAIRAKCLECSNDSAHEVTLCPIIQCPLYSYRFGKNPNVQLTEEERARRASHMREIKKKCSQPPIPDSVQ